MTYVEEREALIAKIAEFVRVYNFAGHRNDYCLIPVEKALLNVVDEQNKRARL
jgi:hypothetical protein